MKRSSVGRIATAALSAALAVLLLSSCGNEGEEGDRQSEAIAEYRAYLNDGAAELTTAIEELAGPIRTHKVPRSQSLYVITRVHYGQIEPAAESLGDLDSRIAQFFRRIEKTLWADDTTRGLEPVTRNLLASSEELERKIKAGQLQPAQISNSITPLLRTVYLSKIRGKEQPYADADLVDVAANLEAAGAAFRAIKPTLADEKQKLEEIEAKFREAFAEVKQFGALAREPGQSIPKAAGAIFALYSDISSADLQHLTQSIKALADQL